MEGGEDVLMLPCSLPDNFMEGGEEGSDVALFALLPVIDLQVVRIHVLKTFMLKTPCQNFSNTF